MSWWIKRPDLYRPEDFQTKELTTLVNKLNKFNRKHPYAFGSYGGEVNRRHAKEAEAFTKIFGSNNFERRKVARTLAQELDRGQGKYEDLKSEDKGNSYTVPADFNLGFGLRPIDLMMDRFLLYLENMIRQSNSQAGYRWPKADGEIIETAAELFKNHSIERRIFYATESFINFIGEIAKASDSIPGRARILAKLTELSHKVLNQGLNNPNPNRVLAKLAKDIDRLVADLDKEPISTHELVDFELVAKANAVREERKAQAKKRPIRSRGRFRFKPSKRTGFYGLAKPIPRRTQDLPEPFAKTLADSGIFTQYDRSKLSRLDTLIERYQNLSETQEAELKANWLLLREVLLKRRSSTIAAAMSYLLDSKPNSSSLLKSLDLSLSRQQTKATNLAFLVAEAKFNPQAGNTVEDLQDISKALQDRELAMNEYYEKTQPEIIGTSRSPETSTNWLPLIVAFYVGHSVGDAAGSEIVSNSDSD